MSYVSKKIIFSETKPEDVFPRVTENIKTYSTQLTLFLTESGFNRKINIFILDSLHNMKEINKLLNKFKYADCEFSRRKILKLIPFYI